MNIEIVPSGRIDYCVDCNDEHGYECPLDTLTLGALVKKKSGYLFPGTIVAVFKTHDKKTRFVVEMHGDTGLLHIFNSKQLELI